MPLATYDASFQKYDDPGPNSRERVRWVIERLCQGSASAPGTYTGDPLTSADVKYTFDRILDQKTAAVARSFFADVTGIAAPDPQTVVFTLKAATAALIAYMAHPNTAIVSKKIGEGNLSATRRTT